MINRAIQYFFVAAASLMSMAVASGRELQPGDTCKWSLTDVDQRRLSSGDGHVTIIVIAGREEAKKARVIGDRVPRPYVGDPKFRFITLINFRGNIFGPFRGLTTGLIRRRLDTEAKRIQQIYTEKGLKRNARQDLFAVADYDGAAVTQFGFSPNYATFTVFVFDENGRVRGRWGDVPSIEALNAALVEAR